jgi:hypothetical protein
MRILAIAALACMGAAGAAGANPAKEDKIVCKRQYDASSGSHFRNSKKVCMKQSEWKEMEDVKDRVMREMGERGASNPDSAPSASAPQ